MSVYKVFISLALCFLSLIGITQDLTEEISSNFSSGNAEKLAEYFQETVDIGLPDKDNDYSKVQGTLVMKDFFTSYPPDNYTVEQQGNTDKTTQYIIGTYTSANRVFQVLIILKLDGENFLIHKIKIEKAE